jgi:DNA-binding winged helix-turn-helix (wHTH) protein/TolB-like protein
MEHLQSGPREVVDRIRFAAFSLDLQHGELLDAQGRHVGLRKQALDVLLLLASNLGHVVAKDELLRRVWPGVVVTEDSLVQAIADIRRVLGDHDHTMVQTVPRRGYLLPEPSDAGARAVDATAAGPPVEEGGLVSDGAPVPSLASAAPAANAHRRWVVAAAALLAAASLWLAWTQLRGSAPTLGAPQIAVLAFHERGLGVEDASLGTGFSEDLTMELGRNQGLNVVAHHSSFAVSGKGLSTAELGRQLHAQYLIDGVVQRYGERLDVAAELIDVRADRVLWVSRWQTEGGQVAQARDEIVAKVAGTLLSKVRESEKQRAVRAPPKSLDVYALTQRGLALKHQFTPESTREGRAALQRALELDPHYGPAWWTLGYLNAVDAHLGLSGEWNHARMHEAIAQINRGIELDPYSSTAYEALKSAYDTGGHEQEALAAAQRAIELGPGDAEAWLWYADAALKVRPAGEALPPILRALEMDPIAPVYFDAVSAKVLWGNGRADAALQKAEACARRAPLYSDCRFVQLLGYAEKGQIDRAREQVGVLQGAQMLRKRGCSLWAGSPAVVAKCLELATAAGLPE